jgi:DnaJ-class molecular chaperone
MIDLQIMWNPEKYGYEQCPHCNGYGSSLKEDQNTCSRCFGSGLVKKADRETDTRQRPVDGGYFKE